MGQHTADCAERCDRDSDHKLAGSVDQRAVHRETSAREHFGAVPTVARDHAFGHAQHATAFHAQPSLAVAGVLKCVVEAGEHSLEEAIAEERRAVRATSGTPDAAEGMRAFLEKRKPRFHRDTPDG